MQLEDSTEAKVVEKSQKNNWIQNMALLSQVTSAFQNSIIGKIIEIYYRMKNILDSSAEDSIESADMENFDLPAL